MRAEVIRRNQFGSFEGPCPSCETHIIAHENCGDEFVCHHCSCDIEIQNYDDNFLFVQAKVKLLPRARGRAERVDPDSYVDY
jgi:hypothetical protein